MVLDSRSAPFYHWFTGGLTNTCFNALDRHVEGGRAEQAALIYDSPVAGVVKSYTYRELRDMTALCAGALAGMGVGKGDRVIIYMPMVPEAVVAMLACARLGAVHSVVFGGFAANELAVRINDAEPKVIISASCGIEVKKVIEYKPLLDEAIRLARHKPERCLIFQRPMAKAALTPHLDVDWNEAMAAAKPHECVPVSATDPLYILYTSGTTGQPKGVVRDTGGHIVALQWTLNNIYDCPPGSVFWAASDIGWVVGHSYIVYGPLFNGNTTVLYEGKPVGTPDPGAFWRVISQHKVRALFTAPTAFRAIKRDDPNGEYLKKYDISCLKTLFLAGERCDPDTLHWAERLLKIPVIDHWWQTETGWRSAPIASGIGPAGQGRLADPGRPRRGRARSRRRRPGSRAQHAGRAGHQAAAAAGELPDALAGRGALQEDLPRHLPRLLPDLRRRHRRRRRLRPRDEPHRRHHQRRRPPSLHRGDGGSPLLAPGRRAECAVIGVHDQLKGQVPLGFLVLKAGVARPDADIVKEVVGMVRDKIGPVAAFKTATVIKRLPKTRSGKILRGIMRRIADSEPYNMPATIDDPAILGEMTEALQHIGYAKKTE